MALDQGDPLAEADFHMAYGLYDQAADLVQIAISREPNRRELKLKLLEVFFVWGNKDRFLLTARELAGSLDLKPGAPVDLVSTGGVDRVQTAAIDSLTVGARTVKGAFRLVNANGEPGEFLRITQVSVRNPDTNAELQLPQVMLAGIYYVTLPMLAIMARLDQAPYLKPVNAAPAPAVPNPAVVTTETFLNAIGSSVTAVGHAGVAELLTPQSPAARSTIENSMSARNLGAVGRAASDQLFMGRSTLRVATTLLPLSWMYGGDGNVVQAL